MRVLVFSQAAWDDTNSFGNTVTNWFEGWNDTEFFHFYARKNVPDNNIVTSYYTVSAVEILKSFFSGKTTGKSFSKEDLYEKKDIITGERNEQLQISKLHNSKSALKKELVYYAMEKVWLTKKWINSNFLQYIDEIDPDIIFAFAADSYILEPAIKEIKKRKNVCVVLWIADDVLSYIEHSAFFRRKYLKKTYDYIINNSDQLYGATIEMCEKYSGIYGKDVIPLYKGCSFDYEVKEYSNNPLRIIYAGNLLYGRADILSVLAKAIAEINAVKQTAVLMIYSNTPMDEDMRSKLSIEGSSMCMGTKPYKEIKRILNKSDIVLHVESFEKDQIEKVQYSFSTKIIDCLQSGSAVVAIGPQETASIEYLRKVDGALVIDDINRIELELRKIINGNLIDYAKKTREYAIRNQSRNTISGELHKSFEDMLSNNR